VYAAPRGGTLPFMGIEDPDADVAEQRRLATMTDDNDERDVDTGGVPLEADPADVAEQREEVPEYDEDER
jgi:hypothetical protein